MDDQLQDDLAVERVGLAGLERRAQVPLHHREHRLDLPALAVLLPREPPLQPSSPAAPRSARPSVLPLLAAHGRREDALDAELLAAEDVRSFALVARVAQDCLHAMSRERLSHEFRELDDVGLRSAVDVTAQDEVALHIADGRELRETALVVPAVMPAPTGVVAGYVACLHAGRIDRRGLVRRGYQAAALREPNRLVKESSRAPFFRRRRSA